MNKLSVYLFKIYPYLFTLLYFILLMYMETSTLFAFQNTSFHISFDLFLPYILYSGGLLEYVGLFFNEIIKFNGAGAALYSLMTLASILLYRRFLVKAGIKENIILITSLLPFVFVTSFTFNHFHVISINLKLLTSLLSLNVLISLSGRSIITKLISISVLIVTWYICGLPYLIIVLSCFAIYTFIKSTFISNLIVFIISGLIVYLLNFFVIYSPAELIFKNVIEYRSQIPYLLLYTYILFIIIPITAFIRYKFSVHIILQFLVILFIGFVLGNKSFDKTNHIISKIMAAGNANDYNEVLRIRDNTTINSRIISNYTNIALLNKGVLLDRMFTYDQGLGEQGLFPSFDFDNYNAFSNMKLCFDLGLMNQTIRWAMESSTYFGYNFEILRHLILSYLVIDNLKAAEKYYAIMDNILFNNRQKRRIRRILDNYIINKPDKILIDKRRLMPERDFISVDNNEAYNFAWALRGNNNFRAFEFYTGICLANYDMSRLEEIIRKFRLFRTSRLPFHVQEAVCLFSLENNRTPVLYNFQIDRNIMEQCAMFYQTLNNYNNNLQAARNELSSNFENTYWYYLNYLSPLDDQ